VCIPFASEFSIAFCFSGFQVENSKNEHIIPNNALAEKQNNMAEYKISKIRTPINAKMSKNLHSCVCLLLQFKWRQNK
jgi:hypothetical protein